MTSGWAESSPFRTKWFKAKTFDYKSSERKAVSPTSNDGCSKIIPGLRCKMMVIVLPVGENPRRRCLLFCLDCAMLQPSTSATSGITTTFGALERQTSVCICNQKCYRNSFRNVLFEWVLHLQPLRDDRVVC